MEIAYYQNQALTTANSDLTWKETVFNWCLGLGGESGEVLDMLKKHLCHGHELKTEKIEKELGDVLWYVSALASTLGLSLEDIAQKNLLKLQKRYKEGFSKEASINREEYKIGGSI